MSASLSLRAPTPLEYFAALVADEQSLNLLEAAITIAQDEFPQLDVQQVLAEVDALAQRLKRRLPADAAAAYRLRALNQYFHQELGFAGNVNNYYEAGNSFVHHVLATRRGIPITLAVIYMELAAQIGLRVQGVAFPGHFLLKLRLPQGEVVLDPFSGRSLTRHALEEFLLPYRHGAGLPDDQELPMELFLQAASARQVLARMLRNLKEIHRSGQDWPRLLQVQQRLVTLLPGEAAECRDRAMTWFALGDLQAAAVDLAHYLAEVPDAPDRLALESMLQEWRAKCAKGGPTLH